MNTEYLLPLDIDLEEGSMIYTLATERDLHDKLKLSVREFPLDQLREVDMRGVGQWAAGLGVAPPMSFLFHLPFCGSTLLSHFLVAAGWCVLRDPAIIAATFQTDRSSAVSLRPLVTQLLSHAFGDRPKIIRTAGYHPSVMTRLHEHMPRARKLFVYADPEFFMLQVLKDPRRREDLRLLAAEVAHGQQDGGHDRAPPDSDADCAIDFWIASARQALAIGDPLGTVNAAQLMERQPATFAAVQSHFGGKSHGVDTWLAGLTQHAKTGACFDAGQQRKQLSQHRELDHEAVEGALRRFRSCGGEALWAALRSRDITDAT
ncbi:hypothetical protein [Roseateles sp. MS654]|uniref:hypothetical protein n=1 Tax=Roseateles sp. MS654 TaxID=3412685 RepID=UPI003C30BA9C